MTSRSLLTKIPMSGDALTDWLFRQFVSVLKGKNLVIQRKRRLHDPDDRSRRTIRGLMDPFVHPSGEFIHIFINPAKDANRNRDEEMETLIHELAHVVMEKTPERNVLQFERIFASNISVAQRRYLKSFLPTHVVKHYPRMTSDSVVATS